MRAPLTQSECRLPGGQGTSHCSSPRPAQGNGFADGGPLHPYGPLCARDRNPKPPSGSRKPGRRHTHPELGHWGKWHLGPSLGSRDPRKSMPAVLGGRVSPTLLLLERTQGPRGSGVRWGLTRLRDFLFSQPRASTVNCPSFNCLIKKKKILICKRG